MDPHKGKELNNVKETWERNEKEQPQQQATGGPETDLDQRVQQEAADYDQKSGEDKLLGGDRASVSDDE